MLHFTHKARTAVRILTRPLLEQRERAAKEALYRGAGQPLDPAVHLREAAEWLMRAQDFGTDRGVSYGADIGGSFLPSYPETTGYIIPTFLVLSDYWKRPDLRTRAIEMGQWESAIQLDSGAVMGGMYNTQPTPAVFNTGMVLLGWSALYEQTGSEQFRLSGERAGRWLVDLQDSDGAWRRGNSQFANGGTTLYNVKAAWGLARMGVALEKPEYVQAAIRNAQHAAVRQQANGWFPDCCLIDARRPLLHTIAYTMQGLIGIGRIARREDFIEAAAKTARSLRDIMHEDGFIPGAIASDFHTGASWACLTGTAQTSIVWSALERITGDRSYGEAAERANRYLMARQDVSNPNPALRGGIAGSWPVSGAYGRYKVLNWATKFFADALLMRDPSAASEYLA